MIRKAGFIIIIITISFLVACNDDISPSNDYFVNVQWLNNGNDLDLDNIPFLVSDFETGGTFLVDLLTNDVMAEFSIDNVRLFGVSQLSMKYYSAFGLSGIEEDNLSFTITDLDIPYLELSLFILDDMLNIIEEIEITDSALIMTNHIAAVSYEQDRLLIYYPDWQCIYVYNVNEQVSTRVVSMEEDIFLNQVRVISANELAFTARGFDDDVNFYYGLINLETLEIQLFYEAHFHQHQMIVYGYNLILTDDSRSEIIVLNLLTRENRIIQLDNNESQNVKLVGDGRFILTRYGRWHPTHYSRIRLYDIETLEILLEHEITADDLGVSEEILLLEFIEIDKGVYGIVIGAENMEFYTLLIMIGADENELY